MTRLAAVDLGGVPGPVASGVGSLRHQLASLSADLTAVSTAARVMPTCSARTGPRHYLVVFQNNAEARGTGGLVGAYAVVTAAAGPADRRRPGRRLRPEVGRGAGASTSGRLQGAVRRRPGPVGQHEPVRALPVRRPCSSSSSGAASTGSGWTA